LSGVAALLAFAWAGWRGWRARCGVRSPTKWSCGGGVPDGRERQGGAGALRTGPTTLGGSWAVLTLYAWCCVFSKPPGAFWGLHHLDGRRRFLRLHPPWRRFLEGGRKGRPRPLRGRVPSPRAEGGSDHPAEERADASAVERLEIRNEGGG